MLVDSLLEREEKKGENKIKLSIGDWSDVVRGQNGKSIQKNP